MLLIFLTYLSFVKTIKVAFKGVLINDLKVKKSKIVIFCGKTGDNVT
jgi:hypothetical protein